MWRKLSTSAVQSDVPVLEAGVILSVPDLMITPSLEVIQQAINEVVQQVLPSYFCHVHV